MLGFARRNTLTKRLNLTILPNKFMQDIDPLQQLKTRLSEAQRQTKPDYEAAKGSIVSNFGRMSADLIAGFAVGAFLGYHLDVYLGTLPLFLFVLTIFGMAAGFRNYYRDLTKKLSKERNENMK